MAITVTVEELTLGGKLKFSIKDSKTGRTYKASLYNPSAPGYKYLEIPGDFNRSTPYEIDLTQAQMSFLEPLDKWEARVGLSIMAYKGSTYQGESFQTYFYVKVPQDWVPTLSYTLTKADLIEGLMIQEVSTATLALSVDQHGSVSPITYTLTQRTTPDIGATTSVLAGSNVYITASYSDELKYRISLAVTATDARGSSSTVEISDTDNSLDVYAFPAPRIIRTNVHRCDASGNLRADGTYALVSIETESAEPIIAAVVDINGSSYPMADNKVIIPGFDIGTQYEGIVKVKTNRMNRWNAWVTADIIVPTMAMPISLFDNGAEVAVSVGEMARSYSQAYPVLNFTQGCLIRTVDDTGANPRVVKAYSAFQGCPFAVGGIYLSTSNTNPATIWPETSWTRIEGKFLLGASSSHPAGETGGEESHTITINEMPAHSHSYDKGTNAAYGYSAGDKTIMNNNTNSTATGDAGGNAAMSIMPPYLSVYIFERIS